MPAAAFFGNGGCVQCHAVAGRSKAGVDEDLQLRLGPIEPVLARLDPLLRTPIDLTGGEFEALVAFVRDALLDERATKQNLCP